MIRVTKFEDKQVVVLGLGKSGLASAKSLLIGGAKLVLYDDNKDYLTRLVQNNFPDNDEIKYTSDPAAIEWSEIKAVVVSPGIDLTTHPVISKTQEYNITLTSDIELLQLTCPHATYIGITGTNGKSTTTSLIGYILQDNQVKSAIGGNIGEPALALDEFEYGGTYVLELSSFQLDLLSFPHFHVAILLNITKDHLDRHGNMEKYIEAKKKIFFAQDNHDLAIISIDNKITADICDNMPRERVVPISTKKILDYGVSVINNVIYCCLHINNITGEIEKEEYQLGELANLPGEHNAENIAASFAAIYKKGDLPAEAIIKSIQNFPGLKHRMQIIKRLGKVTFINDSKATNAEAASKALASSRSNIYWLIGGIAKEGGIDNIEEHLLAKVTKAYLFGQDHPILARRLSKTEYKICQTMEEAVMEAYQDAKEENKEAVILLSPACASFDQFKNFEERVDIFIKLVQSLC